MNKKNNNPLISVIIPVYNGEKFLDACLDSVVNQDYDNTEIIIINDGSSDSSSKIIDSYCKKHNNIKYIYEDNSGVSFARNNALSHVNGEYVCFVDQDDTVDSNYVSYFYSLIEKYNADIATSYQPFKFSDILDKKTEELNDNVIIIDGQEAAKKMLYYKLVIAPWNKMISMKLINDYNIKFNEKLFGGEGFKFSIDCFKNSKKVALSNNKIYNYRCDNPTSGMTKFKMQIVDSSIYAQQLIWDEMIDKDSFSKPCKYANWHTYTDLYNYMIGCNVVKIYKAKYKEIKKVVKKDAIVTFSSPISMKEKIKGLMYFVNPYLASKIVNKCRVRKFTVEDK